MFLVIIGVSSPLPRYGLRNLDRMEHLGNLLGSFFFAFTFPFTQAALSFQYGRLPEPGVPTWRPLPLGDDRALEPHSLSTGSLQLHLLLSVRD